MKAQPLISIDGVSKRFGGTQALDGVTFGILPGEIHAVVGENGAGKTTLMNILSGVIRQDSGSICLRGVEIKNTSPKGMQELGIATVYQELNLLPNRDAAQNIFAGREPRRNRILVDKVRMCRTATESLKRLSVDPMPTGPVRFLPIAIQQLIEIAKILLRDAEVVIMDEPNSALTDRETHRLFEIIGEMKSRGITVIYISHRIDEVLRIADRITVLRDGRYIDTLDASKTDVKQVVSLMVGRRFEQLFPDRDPSRAVGAEVLFGVRGLGRKGAFQDVSFFVRRGEIVGVFGLEGSGRTDMAEAIMGVKRADCGEILLGDRPASISSPFDAIRKGIAYVPPDRKQEGLILGQTVGANIVLSSLRDLSRFGVLSQATAYKWARAYASKLAVRCSGMGQRMVNLSGGNQQKVVLAKGLAVRPKVVILNEPTRGIDVGAKQEIYKLMLQLASEGMGIIFISSELPEIMALSDRIIVVYLGRVVRELLPDQTGRDEVLAYACGSA